MLCYITIQKRNCTVRLCFAGLTPHAYGSCVSHCTAETGAWGNVDHANSTINDWILLHLSTSGVASHSPTVTHPGLQTHMAVQSSPLSDHVFCMKREQFSIFVKRKKIVIKKKKHFSRNESVYILLNLRTQSKGTRMYVRGVLKILLI